jgi:hypothetical protein
VAVVTRDVRLDHAELFRPRRVVGRPECSRARLEASLARPYAQAVAAEAVRLDADVARANEGGRVDPRSLLAAEAVRAVHAVGGRATAERVARELSGLGLTARGAACVLRALVRAGVARATRTRRRDPAWELCPGAGDGGEL